MNPNFVIIAALFLAGAQHAAACGDKICNDYGVEPRFDDSDRPPNAVVLGRATWTMLHTTAAYLPDKLNENEKDSWMKIVRSVVTVYPGKAQQMVSEIYNDAIMQKELQSVEVKEDAMLWAWKFHNAVRLVHHSSTPLYLLLD